MRTMSSLPPAIVSPVPGAALLNPPISSPLALSHTHCGALVASGAVSTVPALHGFELAHCITSGSKEMSNVTPNTDIDESQSETCIPTVNVLPTALTFLSDSVSDVGHEAAVSATKFAVSPLLTGSSEPPPPPPPPHADTSSIAATNDHPGVLDICIRSPQ